MIETWFPDNVREKIKNHHRLVITDARGDGEFLLNYLPRRYKIIKVKTSADEVSARITAERDFVDKNVIFYTHIPQNRLSLLQEYAKTCGCIVLDDMESYLKNLLFSNLKIHSQVAADTLITAAKLGKGKDENWWTGVAQGIINPMDIKSLLLEFLAKPDDFSREQDESVYEQLRLEVCRLTNRPCTQQQPRVFATEVMNSIFDALVKKQISEPLLDLYYSMADSAEMRDHLNEYIQNYSINEDVSPFCAHKDHPFIELDKKCFRLLSNSITVHGDIQPYISYFEGRLASQKAKTYKPGWLQHVVTLLNFEVGNPNQIDNLDSFADYYKSTFAPLDTAMRHLYVQWLNEPSIIRPVQELYENNNKTMLDAWFDLADGYVPTQRGLLKTLFANSSGRTAIIVCDGLRLEMAESIAKFKYNSGIHIRRETAWSAVPSVTPNGMSALYDLPSPVVDSITKRHSELKKSVHDVEIIQLSAFNSSVTAEHLVLLYGDIDHIGEAKQLAGLADIANYEVELHTKITELLRCGYQNVYITTDHGFVITGLLEEADKIVAPSSTSVDERFVTSESSVAYGSFIERHDTWTNGTYQYYAKTDKPFRTRGAYGYSHGGLTPQECLIPVYQFYQDIAQNELKVKIGNKAELSNVTGQFYKIKLLGIGDGSIFEHARKVKLLFYKEDGSKVGESTILNVVVDATTETENELNISPIKVVVVDAITTAQLDTCIIKKSSSRDLGDLF